MEAQPKLILASTSPYRAALLERLGLDFEAVAPRIPEPELPGEAPGDMALRLAKLKADVVAGQVVGDVVVIGGDQVAELDGRLLRKPLTAARAVDQLMILAGRTHRLWTGLCVLRPLMGFAEVELTVTELTMRPWSRAALERYVALDSPLDCAGAYRLERGGIGLFEEVSGPDPSAVEGMSLVSLVGLLHRAGVQVLGPLAGEAV